MTRFIALAQSIAALSACILAFTLCAACAPGQYADRNGHADPGDFDYFVLSLSWAPSFCAHSERAGESRECDPSRRTGFIVHGLWPEREHGRSPEVCAPVRPVSHALVDSLLSIMPDRGLIQHEWRTHGSCTAMSPSEYFGLLRRAYERVHIPPEFVNAVRPINLSVPDLEQQFARGSGLPASGVRVACREGELSEVRVCFTRNLEGRPCSRNLRDCPAEHVTVPPVQ